MTTVDRYVTSRATITQTELSVTAPYSGNGTAASYSTASVRGALINKSDHYDVWYRIDAGDWRHLRGAGTASFEIDFSTQSLYLKRGEFAASPVLVQLTADGVPSGVYADATALDVGGSVTADAIAAALATAHLELPDLANTAPGAYTLANSGVVVKNAAGDELYRIWGNDPDANNYNAQSIYIGLRAGFSQPVDNVDAGYFNVGVGTEALYSITKGASVTAIGNTALRAMTEAFDNTAVGNNALLALITGSNNTAVGSNSLSNATGAGNSGLGYQSGVGLTAGDDNTFLGFKAGLSAFAGSNSFAIGANAEASASNRGVLGDANVTDVYFGSETGASKLHGKGDAIVFPDADPHVAGAAYWVAGVLTKSAG